MRVFVLQTKGLQQTYWIMITSFVFLKKNKKFMEASTYVIRLRLASYIDLCQPKMYNKVNLSLNNYKKTPQKPNIIVMWILI